MKKVHIIGIAGKTTSSLAQMFVDAGWRVTGSDQGAYPPTSTYLEQIGISVRTPYHPDNIPDGVDLVVVGGNALLINPRNPEYLRALGLGIEVQSFAEVLQQFVVKANSIVVVGNYGKGTIAGAMTKALTDLGVNPSYMVAGLMADLDRSLVETDSMWSVIEGDEYPTPPLSGKPVRSKFFYYHPRYLILTSAEWDHFDQFPTEEDYINNYVELVRGLPPDGLLVVNRDGENIERIIAAAPCRVVTYGVDHPDSDYRPNDAGLTPKLLGKFNLRHLIGAFTLLTELGFDPAKTRESLNSYQGLYQRMSVIHETDNSVVVRDLAHSPIKAKGAIEATRQTWPDRHIVAVLDIVASSLKNRLVLPRLAHTLDQADLVLIPRVKVPAHLPREEVVTGKEIIGAIRKTQPSVEYYPKQEYLLRRIIDYPDPKVILLMSSGGMDGLVEKLIDQLATSGE